jgi:hypothetical protein
VHPTGDVDFPCVGKYEMFADGLTKAAKINERVQKPTLQIFG